jgi:ABC-type bacteriocin/lantibiotic exporter with double-glycine peptidase domain
MDCGPASLKCLLEGYGIPVSYGRLREACQTDVDGTSIDTIETVAQQLGLDARQVLIPADHVLLEASQVLPAILVLRHAGVGTHFVVVWRRVGSWVQIMDPASGRRWVRARRLEQECHLHTASVLQDAWRDWAGTADFGAPLVARLRALGATGDAAQLLLDKARADEGWFSCGALDACLRFLSSVVKAGGMRPGASAMELLSRLHEQTCSSTGDIFALVPPDYWSARPDPDSARHGEPRLLVTGAVVMHAGPPLIDVLQQASAPEAADDAPGNEEARPALSPELRAALREPPVKPLGRFLELLRGEGVIAPAAMLAALLVAVGAVVLETLLFRGLFDVHAMLALPWQRLAAACGLLLFVLLLGGIEWPIVGEVLRLGRKLELRLRIALLEKLPRLADRYFQSRPVSDMADRGHSLHAVRAVPQLAVQGLQTAVELLLTFAGLLWLDVHAWIPATLLVIVAVGLPLLVQPLLSERDLRTRIHAGALGGFYLDALLGLVPIRAHRAQAAVRRLHEGLLTEWARAARALVRLGLGAQALQSLLSVLLAGILVIGHFQRTGGVSGADLLLIYWALKLPAMAARLLHVVQQYPAQRNVLLRLLEPIAAPADREGGLQRVPSQAGAKPGMSLSIRGGEIVAGGHRILADVNLEIASGEHVAIVGPSGAGKSTLVGLMLGWHRLAAGRARVDGMLLSTVDPVALRRQIAWVDPAIQLWNRSVLDNLSYASADMPLDAVAPVLDAAQLQKVIARLPQGLQTWLGEGGSLVSGGEGQRLRFARALLQPNVRLALLDEPFRGLDRTQRGALLSEARRWWADSTLLCVTHDVAETMSFDRVLVVEGGRIVEDGSPSALLARDTRYRALLAADSGARHKLWRRNRWRHLRVEEGRAVEGRP